MKDELALAHAWIAKADGELLAARRLASLKGPFDVVCFHGQQSAEKYLKALLIAKSLPLPRTHDLEELLRLLTDAGMKLDLGGADPVELSSFAVEARYDMDNRLAEADGAAAIEAALAVRQAVAAHLPGGLSELPEAGR